MEMHHRKLGRTALQVSVMRALDAPPLLDDADAARIEQAAG